MNSEPEVYENINSETQQDNPIHISDSPEKLGQLNESSENEPDHFLSLPPRKHNPPELIKQLQSDDRREQVLSPAIKKA